MSKTGLSYLPQVSAPYNIVVDKLKRDNINTELVEIDPEELEPIQGMVFSDKVSSFNNKKLNPIYLSRNNKIIDGCHRFANHLKAQKPIVAIRVDLNEMDAIRALNKVQDIYEYEQQMELEEVELQNVINYYNQIDSDIEDTEEDSDFLNELEKLYKSDNNKQKVIGYRKERIKENSANGNFFTLNPTDGYDKYEIEFDNLLDLNNLGIEIPKGITPVELLARIWFPNVNFEKISEPYEMPVQNLMNMAITEKAKKLNYDGIKYGDKIIQGLK